MRFSPNIKLLSLLIEGLLTHQTDVIASLGCHVQQGTRALAVRTLIDTSIQLPGQPSLSSEVLVGINLLRSITVDEDSGKQSLQFKEHFKNK